MSFGKRLKSLRDNKNISMGNLAKEIGTSSSRVSDWENEKTHPSSVFVVEIAKFFGVSTDWLLTGEEYIDSSFSKSGNILTQSDKELIDTIVEESHIVEPTMAKRVVENVVSWLKDETSSTSMESDTLAKMLGAAARFFGGELPNPQEAATADPPATEPSNLTNEEKDLINALRNLDGRDLFEIKAIIDMKNKLSQQSKGGESLQSTLKDENASAADIMKKHA